MAAMLTISSRENGSSRKGSKSKPCLAPENHEHAYQAVSTHDDCDELEEEPPSLGLQLVESFAFNAATSCVIVANGVVVGLETSNRDWPYWDIIEDGFLLIFTFDLLLKLCVERCEFFDPKFQDFGWNIFDLIIVVLGLFDIVAAFFDSAGTGGFATIFRILRMLRILRLFRLVKELKQLYLLAVGLVEACKAIMWVTVLMGMALYVSGIVLVNTVGRPSSVDPHYEFLLKRFGTIGDAMLTLFVMMSSPNLPDFQNEGEDLLETRPLFTVFLVMFITFGSYGMIAMLTGVINESMFENNELRKEDMRLKREQLRLSLEERAAVLFASLPHDERGCASVNDLHLVAHGAAELLDESGESIAHAEILKFLRLMDEEETGYIDKAEFVRGMDKIADGVSPLAIMEIQHFVSLTDQKLTKQMNQLQEVEDKIAAQTQHISDEVDKMLQVVKQDKLEVDEILQVVKQDKDELDEILRVVRSWANQQTSSPWQAPRQDFEGSHQEVVLEAIRRCEAGIADHKSQVLEQTGMLMQFMNQFHPADYATARQDLDSMHDRMLEAVRRCEAGVTDHKSQMMEQTHTLVQFVNQLHAQAPLEASSTRGVELEICESRILSAIAQHSEDISRTTRSAIAQHSEEINRFTRSAIAQHSEDVRSASEKQRKDFEVILASSVQQSEQVVRSASEKQNKDFEVFLASSVQQSEQVVNSVATLCDNASEKQKKDFDVFLASSIQQSEQVVNSVATLCDNASEKQKNFFDVFLASSIQQSEQVVNSVATLCDNASEKQKKDFEVFLASSVKQSEHVVNSVATLCGSGVHGPAWEKLDTILGAVKGLTRKEERMSEPSFSSWPQEAKMDDRRDSVDDVLTPTLAANLDEIGKIVDGVEQRLLSGVPKAVACLVDGVEQRLLSGIAELGGMILSGIADIFSESRSPSPKSRSARSSVSPTAAQDVVLPRRDESIGN